MEKPHKGKILGAQRFGHAVFGEAQGHPDFEDGTVILTSSVIKVDGNEVETRNSRYTVEWAEDQSQLGG